MQFKVSDILYWQAVAAVISAQFCLCYEAMICRGYPPMTENAINKMIYSPLVVWVPAIFGSRVCRMRGNMVISLMLSLFFAMIVSNIHLRPSVGWVSGPLGILRAYFFDIMLQTSISTPFVFLCLHFYECVAGDVWRMVCLRSCESLSFSETWSCVWRTNQTNDSSKTVH